MLGVYKAMTASAARRAASLPMPPQTTTASPFSKNRNLRPPCSRSLTRQLFTNGPTSLSSAATIATLDIPVRPEPLHRAPQRAFHWNDLPSQFTLGLVGTGKHHLAPHAHGIDRRPRLTLQQTARNHLVDNASGKGKKVRQFYAR